MNVAIREAKAHLSKLGDLAHEGESIVVTKNGAPWFKMIPCTKNKRSLTPLQGAQKQISAEEAIKPIDHNELPGWS